MSPADDPLYDCSLMCAAMVPSEEQQESRRAYGTAVSGVVIHQIAIVKWSNSPKFTTIQQSIRPQSKCPDFQTCNVSFMESDCVSTARQLC